MSRPLIYAEQNLKTIDGHISSSDFNVTRAVRINP
jgi:hypothetical protein